MRLKHVPPFKHETCSHSLMSFSQNTPSNPGSQTQVKAFIWKVTFIVSWRHNVKLPHLCIFHGSYRLHFWIPRIVNFDSHGFIVMQCFELLNSYLQSSMLTSQCFPLKPSPQLHSYPGTWLTHVPPFWQGLILHSSISMWQFFPSYPSKHWHYNHEIFEMSQTSPSVTQNLVMVRFWCFRGVFWGKI